MTVFLVTALGSATLESGFSLCPYSFYVAFLYTEGHMICDRGGVGVCKDFLATHRWGALRQSKSV